MTLLIAGQKVITDVTGNDGRWTHLCAGWASRGGRWEVAKNGRVVDQGVGLAEGKTIKGNYII